MKLRGPSEDVDQCAAHLRKLVRELAEKYFAVQIPINKQFHPVIVGRNGANIKKIRDDTGCTIELPNINDDSDVIWIIGPEAEVKIAKVNS